jgi:hypothetical protein
MSMLGRRKHSRYLLSQPIEGSLRVRDEVMVESLDRQEIVVLAPEACRPDELVSLEIPGSNSHRVHARVAESRPVVTEDGAIRHRVRLIASAAALAATTPMEEGR